MITFEILKFIIYLSLIVIISKYILVVVLRKLAESLNLKARTIGNVSGFATSIPEFLTIAISSINGFIGASIYNVLSSNIINFVQYIFSIIINKNQKELRNKVILTDIVLVIITILIPILLIKLELEISFGVVFIFILLFIFFIYVDNNMHKLYLQKEDKILEEEIEKEQRWERGNRRKIERYLVIILLVGIVLFIIGQLLGNCLEVLTNRFNISEVILGIILGFATSIPELITFFEAQKHNKKEKLVGVIESTNNLLISNMLNLFIIQSIGIVLYVIVD